MIKESKSNVTVDQISTIIGRNEALASVFDTVMDKNFITRNRHDWFWLSSDNVPDETGWYHIDRSKLELVKIDSIAAKELQWHQRMYVYGSGHAAVREHMPLALYIGDEYDDGRISALYLCGPDTVTRAALKSP